MQTSILRSLKEHDGYVSGEEISRSLNISRAAIWKYMDQLRTLGYEIEAFPHRGYRLMAVPDKLLPVEVRKEPESALFGGDKAGIAIPAAFLTAATRLLKVGGFLAVEHHETQGDLIADLLAAKFSEIKTIKDLTGRVRFTTARKS